MIEEEDPGVSVIGKAKTLIIIFKMKLPLYEYKFILKSSHNGRLILVMGLYIILNIYSKFSTKKFVREPR